MNHELLFISKLYEEADNVVLESVTNNILTITIDYRGIKETKEVDTNAISTHEPQDTATILLLSIEEKVVDVVVQQIPDKHSLANSPETVIDAVVRRAMEEAHGIFRLDASIVVDLIDRRTSVFRNVMNAVKKEVRHCIHNPDEDPTYNTAKVAKDYFSSFKEKPLTVIRDSGKPITQWSTPLQVGDVISTKGHKFKVKRILAEVDRHYE